MQPHSFNLSGGYEVLTIDAQELKSGSYVFNIVSNGKVIDTGKFIVVK